MTNKSTTLQEKCSVKNLKNKIKQPKKVWEFFRVLTYNEKDGTIRDFVKSKKL